MIVMKRSSLWDVNVARRIESAASPARVGIGIPANAKYGNGELLNEVAFAMEFGNGNVLPRPFVRNAKVEKSADWEKQASESLSEVVDGTKKKSDAMKEIGEKVKADIVEQIDTLVSPPLKESTVAAKKRKRRRNPEKPLIDSGLMKSSFKVEVEGND